jgi:hypothetical protein
MNRKKNGIDFTIDGMLPCWLKPGMTISNGCKSTAIQRIYPLASKTCIEFVDSLDIPTGEYLVFSKKSTEAVTKGVTRDGANVNLQLVCVGDFEVHYGLQMLVNYCLRRIWPQLDDLGFQEVKYSQSDTQSIEFGASPGFLTNFTLQGKTTSTWVQRFETRGQGTVTVDVII